MRFLIVEDSPTTQQLLEFYLTESYGDDTLIDVASSLAEARKIVSYNHYDVVILDLLLQDSLDPMDTLRDFAKTMAIVPTVVITRLVITAILRVGIKESGAKLVMEKQYMKNAEDLKAAVDKAMAK
jgi:DNA-binding response OmpR family regulator